MMREFLSNWFLQAGREPRVVAEINSLPAMPTLMERGHGVTILPMVRALEIEPTRLAEPDYETGGRVSNILFLMLYFLKLC